MLTITKKSAKTWVHSENGVILPFILSKFYFSIDGDDFRIIERGGSRRNAWRFNNITIVDEVGNQTYTGFTSTVELSERLELLRYPAFDFTSEGGIESVQAGTNVTVDNTDPQNPIISATGGGGGVESVTGNIVDNTDPDNPTVNFNAGDYDLEDFNNASSDPFVRESELPEGLDQDNLPIKIDLTLADLGLTEIGTDAEMNTAIKAYFTANNLTVTEKQIPHIRIFDELEDLPDFRFTVDDLDAFWSIAETDFFEESRDINDLQNWIELFEILAGGFNYPEFFSSFNINGNTVSFFGFNEELTETFINFTAFTDVLFLNVLINCRIETFQIATDNDCIFDFRININVIGILGITHTVEEFDNQLLFWAINIASSTGLKTLFLQSVNDLSGSQTILELQDKGWNITIF
jgi:hypothetical protein